jgi:hypothetical protein
MQRFLPERMLRWIHAQNIFFWLLSSIIVTLLAAPFLQDSPIEEGGMFFTFSVVLFFSISEVVEERRHIRLTIALGLIAAALNVGAYLTPWRWLDHLSLGTNMMVFVYVIAHMIPHIFMRREIDKNTLAGAVCVYLLIAIAWAFAYELLNSITQDAFTFSSVDHPTFISDMHELVRRYLYFSFVNISSLGYGDILPRSTLARYLSVFEAIMGQMYLSIFIARLVGGYLLEASRAREKP